MKLGAKKMQLKKYTDYVIRVLILTGMKYDDEMDSIKENSQIYSIYEHHLRKIVFELNKQGLIETIRGRYGGIRLAKAPEHINIGSIVRDLENDFNLLE